MRAINRTLSLFAAAFLVGGFGAAELAAQAHDHGAPDHGAHDAHAGDHDGHHHAGTPVDCRALAVPPWSGLPPQDHERIRRLEASIAHLRTPDAARAAGFLPAFGNIPTMGVHWINPNRSQQGFRFEEPDHLMFAPVGGEETLVGVAYAFIGPLDAETPEAFESELAYWHDHPQLGGPGQTLHMIHVWAVPSPYGPFAGNNYLLPFYGVGIEPPNPCWIQGEDDVERFEQTAMTLALRQLGDGDGDLGVIGAIARGRPGGGERLREMLQTDFDEEIAALDEAARAGDEVAWAAAADALLEARTPAQAQFAEALRQGLTEVQLSSDDRSGDPSAQDIPPELRHLFPQDR